VFAREYRPFSVLQIAAFSGLEREIRSHAVSACHQQEELNVTAIVLTSG
jgi:hypothetical protein